jgi:hypothetical protein
LEVAKANLKMVQMNNTNEKILLRVILMMIPDEISMAKEATTIWFQILCHKLKSKKLHTHKKKVKN